MNPNGWLAAVGIALAGFLGACTVGPDYRPAPSSPGSQAPLVSVSTSAETTTEPPDDWWRLYHDSTLDDLLNEAFKANTDLKVAEANLLASRAVLEGARDARFPQTNAGVGATYGRDAITDEILGIAGHPPQNIWIYEAVLSVGYELDYLGRVRRSIEAARADTDAIAAAHDSVKITVAAETARAYAQICAIGEDIPSMSSVARLKSLSAGTKPGPTPNSTSSAPKDSSRRSGPAFRRWRDSGDRLCSSLLPCWDEPHPWRRTKWPAA
jgi:hypothetical protein